MKRTNSQSLKEVLENFFQDNPRMADKLAETRLINYWTTEMSPVISRYTVDLYIRNRILYVKLNSSVLKNELLMGREELISKLNKEAQREIIHEIIFI